MFTERRHPEPLHRALTIAVLEVPRNQSLGLHNEPVYVFARVENRRIDVLRSPFGTDIYIQKLQNTVASYIRPSNYIIRINSHSQCLLIFFFTRYLSQLYLRVTNLTFISALTYFIMLLQDFPESSKVKILIVLKQYEEKIELGESQLQLLQLARRHWFLVEDVIAIACLTTASLCILRNRQDLTQFVVKRGKSACGLC